MMIIQLRGFAALVLLLLLFTWSVRAGQQSDTIGAIQSAGGYLLVWNESSVHFTLEVNGKAVLPLRSPGPNGQAFFEVDGVALQIQLVALSEFLGKARPPKRDDRSILMAHRDWELSFIEPNPFAAKPSVKSVPQRLNSGGEALLWACAVPNSGVTKEHLYLTMVNGTQVMLLRGLVDEKTSESVVRKLLVDTLSTLKVSSRPINVRALEAAAKAQVFRHVTWWSPDKPGGGPPSRKAVAVRINGKDEYFTFTLFNDSYPFITYVPEGFRQDSFGSDEGYAVIWLPNGGGDLRREREQGSFVQISFPAFTAREASARASLKEAAESSGTLVPRTGQSPRRYRWSLTEYEYVREKGDTRLMGVFALGRHGGSYFKLYVQWQERDKEFLPLVNRLLDELVWKDTKKGL